MKKRLHAFFSGNVQGVGFRFAAERTARRLGVGGYVRNLANGQVEVLAEGEEKTLQEFLEALREAFHNYIRNVEVRWQEASGEHRGFGIKF
jgi:acylphosphatase